jgi:PTH2 family peptidyl-tRNA hydrolase
MKKPKLALVIRKDLDMGAGKVAAQTGHAVTVCVVSSATGDGFDAGFNAWYSTGMKKVALAVKDETELLDICKKADAQNVPYYLVTDAGLTQNAPGTKTCAAIGPASEQKMKRITGSLKLYD